MGDFYFAFKCGKEGWCKVLKSYAEELKAFINNLIKDYQLPDLARFIRETDIDTLLQKVKEAYVMLNTHELEELFDFGNIPDVNDLKLDTIDFEITDIVHPDLSEIIKDFLDAFPEMAYIHINDIYEYMLDLKDVTYDVVIK